MKISKNKGKNNQASKKGVLYDVVTGGNYLFFCLKSLTIHLEINYKGVRAAIRRDKFYANQYYVTFCEVPHETVLNQIKLL